MPFRLLQFTLVVVVSVCHSTPALAQDNRSAQTTPLALQQIFDEDVLQQNGVAVRKQAIAAPAVDQYFILCDWLLPSPSRTNIRFPVTFSTVNGIQSPVLDLVQVAVREEKSEQLRLQLGEAKKNPGNLRQAIAIELLLHLAISPRSSQTARSFDAFMSATDQANVNIDEPDWPRLLVLSQTAGIHQQFNVQVTDLLSPYYKKRGDHFDDPLKDAFFDHMRSLDGRRIHQSDHGGKPIRFGTPPDLKNWVTTSERYAHSQGKGAPYAHWQLTEEGVTKLGGHEIDYLTYQLPLTGNYVVEFDASANSFSVMLAGVVIEFSRKSVKYGGVGNPTYNEQLLSPPLSAFKEWNHFRAVVQDDVLRAHVNGRLLLTIGLPENSDSWFAVRSWRRWRGTLRKFRVTGDPVVSRQVRLTGHEAASNWTDYYSRQSHWSQSVRVTQT